MNKIFLALSIVTLAFISCSSDDDTNDATIPSPPLENIFNGDVVLTSQSEVDDFGVNNYTVINGSLTIHDLESTPNIINLNALASLIKVTNYLYITNNPDLINLQGLNNLYEVDNDFIIKNNNSLINLEGLDRIYIVEGLFTIEDNNSLLNLSGIEDFYTISILKIKGNNSLIHLNELINISAIGDLIISENNSLTTLSGLDNIASALSLEITKNTSLNNFCALNITILDNLEHEFYKVYDNLYNPSKEDLIAGNCSF